MKCVVPDLECFHSFCSQTNIFKKPRETFSMYILSKMKILLLYQDNIFVEEFQIENKLSTLCFYFRSSPCLVHTTNCYKLLLFWIVVHKILNRNIKTLGILCLFYYKILVSNLSDLTELSGLKLDDILSNNYLAINLRMWHLEKLMLCKKWAWHMHLRALQILINKKPNPLLVQFK